MAKALLGLMAVVAVGVATLTGVGQPPDGKGPPKKGPPKYEMGKVLPPHIFEMLELTAEQQKQLDALEKDVKARLEKILTADQKKMIEEFKGPPPKDGPDGPPPKKDKG